MRLPTCRSNAFTLIEVVVATTILGAGILGVVAAIALSTRSGGAALRQAEAAALAQNQMELAVLVREDALHADRGEDGLLRWRLSYDPKEAGLVLAQVTVEWDEGSGPQTFELRRVFLPTKDR